VTVVDGVPEGWRRMAINDIAEYINGYAFKPSDWSNKGKPIIKIKEMGDGVTTDTPRNLGTDIPPKYHIFAGDILFSWSATLSAMIWDGEDGLLNQHLFKVVPYDGFSREYVLQSILYTLDEFQNLTTGATMKHIQRGKLKEVFVTVPNDKLMLQYSLLSEPIRQKILSLKKQSLIVIEARDRLLPKLMSGEMEV
jgi:type I restriction enzyme S subunit